jgi:HPt (histidine-containing phosphotransfer) domain-containing protein
MRVPQELKERFDAALEDIGEETPKESLAVLLDSHEKLKALEAETKEITIEDFGLSESELTEVESALSKAGVSLKAFGKKAFLMYAKTLNKKLESLEQYLNYTYQELEALAKRKGKVGDDSTLPGLANLKIQKFVELVMEHNKGCEQSEDRILINPAIVRKGTNSNFNSVVGWFDSNQDLINQHHEALGIDEENSKPTRGLDVRATLGLT